MTAENNAERYQASYSYNYGGSARFRLMIFVQAALWSNEGQGKKNENESNRFFSVPA